MIGGRRHAFRRGLHRIGRFLQAIQRGAHGSLEFDNPGFHAGGAFGLGGAVLVLIGAQRARLDHALSEDLQRIRHRRDLVALGAAMDFRIEIAVGQKLHRALQMPDPAQDAAADIEPDEQCRSDQREAAKRKHRDGCKRDLLARLPGRGVGRGLHALDELFHADPETDIELAGLFENELAVIVGVEFLLANLEGAGLAVAERQQFRSGLPKRVHCGGFGQQTEIRLDARLGEPEFLFDDFQRVAAGSRQCGHHVECHPIAAEDDFGELVGGSLRLGGVVLGEIGGSVDAVELRLGIDQCGTGGGNEARLGLAQCVVQLLVLGRGLEPFARRCVQALDGVVDALDGFAEGGDDRLVGAKLDDLAQLLQRNLLGFLHLPGAFGQRLFGPGSQQPRSLAGQTGALGRQLQAGREAGNVPAAQVSHRPAEMSEHDSGAGADHNGHARDHGEGGKQAAPDAQFKARQAKSTQFADSRL